MENQPSIKEKKTIRQLWREESRRVRQTDLSFSTEWKILEFTGNLKEKIEWIKDIIVRNVAADPNKTIFPIRFILDAKYTDGYIIPVRLRERIRQIFEQYCSDNNVSIQTVNIEHRHNYVEYVESISKGFPSLKKRFVTGMFFSFDVDTSYQVSNNKQLEIISKNYIIVNE